MVVILYLWYIQNGAPKLLLMAQPLKHPQSESGDDDDKDDDHDGAKLIWTRFRNTGIG